MNEMIRSHELSGLTKGTLTLTKQVSLQDSPLHIFQVLHKLRLFHCQHLWSSCTCHIIVVIDTAVLENVAVPVITLVIYTKA